MTEPLLTGLGIADRLALLAVLLVGLPHGAFDAAVAIRLGWNKLGPMLVFLFSYLALSALIIWLWLMFPSLSLLGFLLISLVHFGLGDAASLQAQPMRMAHIISRGGLVVILLPLIHASEVQWIFAQLGITDTSVFWPYMKLAGLFWIMAIGNMAGHAILTPALRPDFLEFLALTFALIILPPLVGFALYFCLVHSRNHMQAIWRSLRAKMDIGPILFGASVLTLASWFGAVFGYFWLTPQIGAEPAMLQVIFIGLAALTVPHMILIDSIWRPDAFKSKAK